MADAHPSIFATDWDEWEHPKRAIAAIWTSVAVAILLFFISLPTIFDSGIHPAITIGIAVILMFAIPVITVAIVARFD
ncbi:hypothetical protein NGM10_05440 [Halorussus salilacus]|uniref:hypothetical protein n=1 Tax=Halorussus salilacus TaxID=2953750 RepID=UPI00209C9B21|nr:hypothetical protein [Halorussus salilacus]USZ69183.1 hypothetical protein NGM10_05440 [Halorussus salilacus]